MIYVEERDFDRQIEVLETMSKDEEYSVCAWVYPEAPVKEIAGIAVVKTEIEPVTTYGDGFKPFHTELAPLNSSYLLKFKSNQQDLIDHCDSLAIYKGKSTNWAAATIGHEGVCLVRDVTQFNKLKGSGFAVATEAPSWW
jgi:hypothetical protein